MKQVQFFKYTTIILILLNLFMIGFFFLTKPAHPGQPGRTGPPGPTPHEIGEAGFLDKAVELLNLSDDQRDAFKLSAEQHSAIMDSLTIAHRELLKPYFNSIIEPSHVPDTNALALARELESRKITATYDHFLEIQSLLNEDQQDGFSQFMKQAVNMLLLDPQSMPPPRPSHPPR